MTVGFKTTGYEIGQFFSHIKNNDLNLQDKAVASLVLLPAVTSAAMPLAATVVISSPALLNTPGLVRQFQSYMARGIESFTKPNQESAAPPSKQEPKSVPVRSNQNPSRPQPSSTVHLEVGLDENGKVASELAQKVTVAKGTTISSTISTDGKNVAVNASVKKEVETRLGTASAEADKNGIHLDFLGYNIDYSYDEIKAAGIKAKNAAEKLMDRF